MKRWIALAAAVLVVPALAPATPATAQVAPLNPASVLNDQLAKGVRVRVVEQSKVGMAGGRIVNHMAYGSGYNVQNRGSLQLGRSGVVASDMTRRLTFESVARQVAQDNAQGGDKQSQSLLTLTQAHRSISVKGWRYASGKHYAPLLPEGKTWALLQRSSGAAAAFGDQVINVFEPAVLKALLIKKHTDGTVAVIKGFDGRKRKATLYSGTTTFSKLYGLSSTFREIVGRKLDAVTGGIQVGWGVFTDEKGLPFQVISFWELDDNRPHFRNTTTTEYVGWGSPVPIAAPPGNKVARSSWPANGLPEFDDNADILITPQPPGVPKKSVVPWK
jgi:hypothetical protein